MNAADLKAHTALLSKATAKLAWHRQQIAESGEWLDAVAGRRKMAEDIEADLEQYVAELSKDIDDAR